jgi:ankyrin repeat protein
MNLHFFLILNLIFINLYCNNDVKKILPKRNFAEFLDSLKKTNFDKAMNFIENNVEQFDLDQRDNSGDTALIILAKKYNTIMEHQDNDYRKSQLKKALTIIKKIIAAGALLNEQGHANITALIQASINGFEEMVEILLNGNADPNIYDHYKHTALMYASMQNTPKYRKIVKNLLNCPSININLKNDEGQTALDLAEFYDNKLTADIIKNFNNRQCITCTIL